MGPMTLFDKSFLQSLTLDESVWFAHFFSPVVCPLFYVETLADLEKAVRRGRTPEEEVRIIADRFPEISAYPCTHHSELVTASLLGWPLEMDGRPHRSGGRIVQLDGKAGVLFENSKEEEAFARWQRGRFLDVERGMAKQWRRALNAIDLRRVVDDLQPLGIDGKVCKSVADARALAQSVVAGTSRPFERMSMALRTLGVAPENAGPIFEGWTMAGFPALAQFAPYAAHVAQVELFFQFGLAASQIGAERASNRVDISYLHYLPFCMVFVSNDRLHQRSAPLFLREDQEFVWGPDLKADLARINAHFLAFPDSEKERGLIGTFAHAPPDVEGSVVRRLRARFLRKGYDDRPRPESPPNDERSRKLVEQLKRWEKAPAVDVAFGSNATSGPTSEDFATMSIQRFAPKRKGSWWLLPKDLKVDDD